MHPKALPAPRVSNRGEPITEESQFTVPVFVESDHFSGGSIQIQGIPNWDLYFMFFEESTYL